MLPKALFTTYVEFICSGIKIVQHSKFITLVNRGFQVCAVISMLSHMPTPKMQLICSEKCYDEKRYWGRIYPKQACEKAWICFTNARTLLSAQPLLFCFPLAMLDSYPWATQRPQKWNVRTKRCHLGSGLSLNAQSASSMILDSPASRTVGKKCLLFYNPPSIWHFVIKTKQTGTLLT